MRRLTLLILALLFVATFAGSTTSRATTFTLTVTPGTGLVDSQVVDVAWSGFTPGNPVFLYMCKAGSTSTTTCLNPPGDLPEVNAALDGTGIVRFKLKEGDEGGFTCDDTHQCVIAALESQNDIGSGTTTPITFASSPGACPNATAAPVYGEGAAGGAYSMYAWESGACQLSSHLNVTYTNDTSYNGLESFAAGSSTANFAVSGVPFSTGQASHLANLHRGFAYAPLSLTGLSIAYNIVDQSGRQITNLTLTPKIVAEIATGELSTFDCPTKVSDANCVNLLGGDPDIRKLNPGIKFPDGPIHFFDRAENSDTNLALTSWLSQNAPSIWTYGTSTVWPPPDPNRCLTCPGGVTGELNDALAVGFPDSYTNTDVYIGVTDSTYANIVDLPSAKLLNPGQTTPVSPSEASLSAALTAGTQNADGTITPAYNTPVDGAYPLPILNYAVVPTTQKWPFFTADDGKQLAAFLNYTAGDGQSVLPPGSYPLPDNLKTETQTVAGKIPTTEPTPAGGGHHNNGGGGNNGGGSNFGSGGSCCTSTGTGGYTNTSGGGGGSSGPKPSSTPPAATVASFGAVGSHLSSSTSSSSVPILLALALLVVLLGPGLHYLTHHEGQLAAGPRRWLRGLRRSSS
jgi:ABC-type phosphate transport system substrate-binding protein